jgi:hypothetical protein
MKVRVLLPFTGLMMISILLVGGALCGSCNADRDWSLSQAGHHPERVARLPGR